MLNFFRNLFRRPLPPLPRDADGWATIWVDHTRPDDSGSGFSPQEAKRTLQAGLRLAREPKSRVNFAVSR